MIDGHFLVVGTLLGFLELLGIGIAIAILVSVRRARTESRLYFYIPKYRPTVRTPKLAYLPLPLLLSTLFVVIGVLDGWRSQLDSQVVFIGQVLLWIIGIGSMAQLILIKVTTEPLEEDPPEDLGGTANQPAEMNTPDGNNTML